MKKKPLDFKNSLILVVGDLLLDCYWYSQNKYISSKKITSILPINQVKEQPGGAANVAKNIAEIGGKSKIIGFIGMDHEGLILKKIMNHVRIYCDFIALRTQKTITKIRILSKKKQIIRVDFQEKYICNKSDILYKKIVDSLSSYKILVLSDYAKGTLLEIEKIINYANKISIPILIDPKGMNFTKYSGASLLTPNLSEFEKIVGKCYKECEIIQRGIRLLYELKLSALLVTRSKNGMTLFQINKKPIHFPAISQKKM